MAENWIWKKRYLSWRWTNLIGYKHSLKYMMDNHKNPRICKYAKERLKQL